MSSFTKSQQKQSKHREHLRKKKMFRDAVRQAMIRRKEKMEKQKNRFKLW